MARLRGFRAGPSDLAGGPVRQALARTGFAADMDATKPWRQIDATKPWRQIDATKPWRQNRRNQTLAANRRNQTLVANRLATEHTSAW